MEFVSDLPYSHPVSHQQDKRWDPNHLWDRPFPGGWWWGPCRWSPYCHSQKCCSSPKAKDHLKEANVVSQDNTLKMFRFLRSKRWILSLFVPRLPSCRCLWGLRCEVGWYLTRGAPRRTCSHPDRNLSLCCQIANAEIRNTHSICEHTRTSDLQQNINLQNKNTTSCVNFITKSLLLFFFFDNEKLFLKTITFTIPDFLHFWKSFTGKQQTNRFILRGVTQSGYIWIRLHRKHQTHALC